MVKFFKSRKPGPTDLTWEEKNSGDYIYPTNHNDKQRDTHLNEREARNGRNKDRSK